MLSTNRIPKRLRQEVLFLLLVHSLPQQCGGSCGHKRKYYILENGSEEKHGIVSEIVPSASTSQLLPAVGWKLSENQISVFMWETLVFGESIKGKRFMCSKVKAE